jgi:hypothetical protein
MKIGFTSLFKFAGVKHLSLTAASSANGVKVISNTTKLEF